jgi:metallo-beta-lactamase family protein
MGSTIDIPNTDCRARWDVAGHILGAATLTLETPDGIITFSGDLGRYNDPVILPPTKIKFGKLLLIESTYGDRYHEETDVEDDLCEVVKDTVDRGGVLVIPSFAVGRTQALLFYLKRLKEAVRIADIPIIIDSPMATDATEIYLRHQKLLGQGVLDDLAKGERPFSPNKLAFTRDREQSKFINKQEGPFIVISASGMLTGGRVLHHLMHRLGDPRNTILFVGFQPPGSKGDLLQSGIKSLRLMKEEIPVRAQIRTIGGLSAHGDQRDLLRWCKTGEGTPERVMVVHGEPASAQTFSDKLNKELGWNSRVAKFDEEITL